MPDRQGPGGHIPPLAAVIELDFAPVISQVESLAASFDNIAASATLLLASVRDLNAELANTLIVSRTIEAGGGIAGASGGGGFLAGAVSGSSAFGAGGYASASARTGGFRDRDDSPFGESYLSEFLGELTNRLIPVTAVGLYASGQSGRLASDIEFVKNLDFGGVSVDTILKTYAAGRYLTAPIYRGLGTTIGNPILRGAGAFGLGLTAADVGIELAEGLLTGQPLGEALGEASTLAPLLSFGADLRRDLAADLATPSEGYRFGDGARNLYRLWNRRRGYRAPGIEGYEDLGLPDHYWEDLYEDEGDRSGIIDLLFPSAYAAEPPAEGEAPPPVPPRRRRTAREAFSPGAARAYADTARGWLGDRFGDLPADEAASLALRGYTTFYPGTLGRLHGRTLRAGDALASVGLEDEGATLRHHVGGGLSRTIDELPSALQRLEERAASAEVRFEGLAQASDIFARQATQGIASVISDFSQLDDVVKGLLQTIAQMILHVSVFRPLENTIGNLFSVGAGRALPGLVGIPEGTPSTLPGDFSGNIPGARNVIINNYQGVSESQAVELAGVSRAQAVEDVRRGQQQITSEFYTGRV